MKAVRENSLQNFIAEYNDISLDTLFYSSELMRERMREGMDFATEMQESWQVLESVSYLRVKYRASWTKRDRATAPARRITVNGIDKRDRQESVLFPRVTHHVE